MIDCDFLRTAAKHAKFISFLSERGAEVLPATNPFEVARFRATSGVNVIYRNAKWQFSLQGDDIEAAIKAFHSGNAWRALPRLARPRRRGDRRTHALVTAMITRDGADCFYCWKPLGEDITIEHLVSQTAHGPDRLENMVLAHKAHNNEAGTLSVMEKIKMREANRPKGEAS